MMLRIHYSYFLYHDLEVLWNNASLTVVNAPLVTIGVSGAVEMMYLYLHSLMPFVFTLHTHVWYAMMTSGGN